MPILRSKLLPVQHPGVVFKLYYLDRYNISLTDAAKTLGIKAFHLNCFINGKANGKGIFTYTNGDEYVGEFVHGLRSGKGIYIFANGDKYEGEFERNLFNGKGVLTLVNGNKKKGLFKDHKFINE